MSSIEKSLPDPGRRPRQADLHTYAGLHAPAVQRQAQASRRPCPTGELAEADRDGRVAPRRPASSPRSPVELRRALPGAERARSWTAIGLHARGQEAARPLLVRGARCRASSRAVPARRASTRASRRRSATPVQQQIFLLAMQRPRYLIDLASLDATSRVEILPGRSEERATVAHRRVRRRSRTCASTTVVSERCLAAARSGSSSSGSDDPRQADEVLGRIRRALIDQDPPSDDERTRVPGADPAGGPAGAASPSGSRPSTSDFPASSTTRSRPGGDHRAALAAFEDPWPRELADDPSRRSRPTLSPSSRNLRHAQPRGRARRVRRRSTWSSSYYKLDLSYAPLGFVLELPGLRGLPGCARSSSRWTGPARPARCPAAPTALLTAGHRHALHHPQSAAGQHPLRDGALRRATVGAPRDLHRGDQPSAQDRALGGDDLRGMGHAGSSHETATRCSTSATRCPAWSPCSTPTSGWRRTSRPITIGYAAGMLAALLAQRLDPSAHLRA